MAVVDYGSIVKGALKSFNEVDQYIQAEEEREYQKAKERRDHLYKSDRDKMADFWREHQQQYKEYRDNVQDDFNAKKFAHAQNMDNKNYELSLRKQDEIEKQNKINNDLNNRKQDEIEKQNSLKALIAVHNAALEQDQTMNKNKINVVNSRTGTTRGGSANGFVDIEKGYKASVDAIHKNSDSPEQKQIALNDLVDRIADKNQKLYVTKYYEHLTGLQQSTTIKAMNNLVNSFNTVGAEAVKDGKTPTGEQIVNNFVEYANENNVYDIEHTFGSSVDVMMNGDVKDTVNGKEVIIGKISGHVPNSLRFYSIPGEAKVGLVGDFIVNGNVERNKIVTNINGEPIAYDEKLIKAMDIHTLQAQVKNISDNKPKLLSLEQYNKVYKVDNPSESTKYEEYKRSNAMPLKTYDKDPNIKTLKDDKARNWEIDKAVEQSQNKPGTSATSNIYENRYNGKRVGNKVLIAGGKIEVPITEEEDQILKSYKEQADKILSQQFNEDDIAKVQQTYNLSRANAIKYLQDKASQESFNKRFAPMLKKMTTVDVIEKGFQGDFSDNTFDILTNKLKDDYVYIDENANKVISVAEFNKLPKEEQDKFEKTNVSDKEDLDLTKLALSILPPHMALLFDSHGKDGTEKLDASLREFVPNEGYRKTYINQYKEYKKERAEQRASAGGYQGAYLRKFLETKKSVGDKSLPKEKIEEMYNIVERYKDLPLNNDDGKANKEKLLSELKDAGLNGTTMYRVISLLKTDEGKSVNSFREKKYSYTKAIKPEKKSQKLSDATSTVFNANNGLGGYQSTSTSTGGIIKNKEYEGDFSNSLKARDNLMNFVGLNDLNQ